MIKLYLIDDDYRRHVALAKLIQNLNAAVGEPQFECDRCPEHEGEARKYATSTTNSKSVWDIVSTGRTDSIVLVDLKLGDVDESQARVDLLQFLDSSTFPWKNKAKDLIEKASSGGTLSYKTAMFACAVLKARGIATIIVSTLATVADVREFSETFGVPTASLDEALSRRHSPSALSDLEIEILKLRRHPDPHVRKVLNSYASPVAFHDEAWTHDWIPNHANAWSSVLGNACTSTLSIDDAKALFERSRSLWSFETADCRVSKGALELALNAVGIRAEVGCDHFSFPVSPGLAFLIALKELINSCGENRPTSVAFGAIERSGYPVVNWVDVQLMEQVCGLEGLEPVCRFLVKIEEARGNAAVPNGGLSEAVWNLGHCRCGGIRRSEDGWVKMFENGSSHWVAWPSFTPYKITFHWRRPQARAQRS